MIGASEVKLMALATAATAVTVPDTSVLGVPTNILLAALAGALFGLAYSPPGTLQKVLPKKEHGRYEAAGHVSIQLIVVIFSLCANAVVASWAAQILPHTIGLFKSVPHAPFAGALAFAAQNLIPKVFAAAGGWLEKRAKL